MNVSLLIGDLEYTQFTQFSIDNSFTSTADAFSVEMLNKAGSLAGVIAIGDSFRLEIDGELQLIGYVDELNWRGDSLSGSSLSVTGRDLMGQLIDCNISPRSYTHKTLRDIAVDVSQGVISNWSGGESDRIGYAKVDTGDTAYEFLSRCASKLRRGIWCEPDGTGKIGIPGYSALPRVEIVLCRSGTANARRNNVKSWSIRDSIIDRFSDYTVYGITGRGDNKEVKGKSALTDASVSIPRRKIIVDSAIESYAQATRAVEMERNAAIFGGFVAEYTVNGFIAFDGQLYRAGDIATVEDEINGVYGEYFVAGRRFDFSAQNGRTTTLTLTQKNVWP